MTVSDYASACSFTDELDIVVLNPTIVSNEDFGIIRDLEDKIEYWNYKGLDEVNRAASIVMVNRLICGARLKLQLI